VFPRLRILRPFTRILLRFLLDRIRPRGGTLSFFKLAKTIPPAHYPNNIRVWPTDCRRSSSAKVAEYSPDIYLAAAVGRHNAVFFELVVARRRLQRAGHQLGAHVLGHRIADHLLVEAVNYRRQRSQSCHVLM